MTQCPTTQGPMPAPATVRTCLRTLAAVAVLAAGLSAPARAEPPAEPPGYRLEPYRAPTPLTVDGVAGVSTGEVERLWRAGAVILLDVLPRPPRPAALPADTVWRDPPHDSIPGAHWLPNVGFGALDAATTRYFLEGLAALTAGNRAAPVVIYCLRDCWMSWNAVKRARAAGYTAVGWYPAGVDGWKEAGLPLVAVEPWHPASPEAN